MKILIVLAMMELTALTGKTLNAKRYDVIWLCRYWGTDIKLTGKTGLVIADVETDESECSVLLPGGQKHE